MDAFQVRLDCLALLRSLNASQQSIVKVVDFAVRHAAVAGEDIWQCLFSEGAKASLNTRLNILFLIDALLFSIIDPIGYSSFSDASSNQAASTPAASTSVAASAYLTSAARDLARIVDTTVPSDNWEAVRLNAAHTQKLLASWRRLGIFDSDQLQEQIEALQGRRRALADLPTSSHRALSRAETLRRIEQDRERHKRLRERAWILPAKSFVDAIPIRSVHPAGLAGQTRTATAKGSSMLHPNSTSSSPLKAALPTLPETSMPPPLSTGTASANRSTTEGRKPDALDLEFDEMWDNVSEVGEDDRERLQEYDRIWWGGRGFALKQAELERQRQAALPQAPPPAPPSHGTTDTPSHSYDSSVKRQGNGGSVDGDGEANGKRRHLDREGHEGVSGGSRDRTDNERPPLANRWRRVGPQAPPSHYPRERDRSHRHEEGRNGSSYAPRPPSQDNGWNRRNAAPRRNRW